MPLADTQAAVRAAIVERDAAAIMPLLIGGRDPTYRLSIHQRHYRASVVEALRRRYPTVEWLVGSAFFNAAAIDFVRQDPPHKPCIAEYGSAFPDFLAGRPGAERLPWLAALGALEWQLGLVTAAVDQPAVTLAALAAHEDLDLGDIRLRLQPGLAYLAAEWPIDDLVRLRLDGSEPDTYAFDPARTLLEVRGARGKFDIHRLDAGTYAFRSALAADRPIADAIAAANAADAAFDPGQALAALFGERLVVAVATPRDGR